MPVKYCHTVKQIKYDLKVFILLAQESTGQKIDFLLKYRLNTNKRNFPLKKCEHESFKENQMSLYRLNTKHKKFTP